MGMYARRVSGCAIKSFLVGTFLVAKVAVGLPGPASLLQPLPVEVAAGVKHFGESSLVVSPDAGMLAFDVTNERNQRPFPPSYVQVVTSTGVPIYAAAREVWVYELKGKRVTKLAEGKSSSWAPAWSPDGQKLAFFSDRDGGVRVWLWDRASGRVSRASEAIVRVQGLYSERPEWMSNGKGIFTKFLPEGMTLQEALDLQVEPAPADTGKVDELTVVRFSTKSTQGSMRSENVLLCDLGVIDLPSGTVRRFVSRVLAERYYQLSPDRALLAYKARFQSQGADSTAQFTVVSLSDGAVKFARPDRPGEGADCVWSPNSRYLACMLASEREDEKFRVLDARTFDPVALGATVPGGLSLFGSRWDPDSRHLYSRIGKLLWRIPVNSSGNARKFTLPQEAVQVLGDANQSLWHPDGPDSLAFVTFDRATMRAGYRAMNFVSGRSRALLDEQPDRYVSNLLPLPGSRDFVYSVSDVGHFPDLWKFDAANRTSRRLTVIDPEYDRYEMGRSLFVEWETKDGRKLHGPLLLPAGYQPGRRYPLAVWVYAGQSVSSPDAVGLTGTVQFNFQVLATRGYAVFFPEAPQRVGSPMADLADAVLPAIDRVVDMGIADPDRLAVMGNSYGGYSVQALIVQTTRFKAAIMSVSAPGDIFMDYITPPYTGMEVAGLSTGQMKMSGSPWQHRDQYIQNSPFFFYDKTRTPLLIAQGTNDGFGRTGSSNATYNAFHQLGLDAEYLLYYGEGHAIIGYSNQVDFWQRRLDFLSHHMNLVLDNQGAIVFDGQSARAAH